MAFASRSLRILGKIYNGSCSTSLSTLRKPVRRINLFRAAKTLSFSTTVNPPKVTGSLTNIQTPGVPMTPWSKNSEKIDLSQKDLGKEEDKEEKERHEKSWKWMKRSFVVFGITMTIGGFMLVYDLTRPIYNENGKLIEDEFTKYPFFQQHWMRLCKGLTSLKKFIQEPSREKLLPDPLQYPYMQPSYTLVLELTDVLIHPDWTYQTGWRFKKRPGVDRFLEALAPPNFEIVVYTAEHGNTVLPILDCLDPRGFIMYRLFRDATRYVDGQHIKDLDALNRDLSKVILVDWNENSVKFHPENTFMLPRWNGNDDDTTLYDLADFLNTIAATNVDDVRDVLNYFRQFNDPIKAFRENQRKLLQQMEDDETQRQQLLERKTLASKWSQSFLRSR